MTAKLEKPTEYIENKKLLWTLNQLRDVRCIDNGFILKKESHKIVQNIIPWI